MVVDKFKPLALVENWNQISFLKLIYLITVGETPARSAFPTTRVRSAALLPPKTITPSSAFGPGLTFTNFLNQLTASKKLFEGDFGRKFSLGKLVMSIKWWGGRKPRSRVLWWWEGGWLEG